MCRGGSDDGVSVVNAFKCISAFETLTPIEMPGTFEMVYLVGDDLNSVVNTLALG